MTLNHVLSPIRLADLVLPNRIMMGSMHVGLEKLAGGIQRLADFYAERAKGKVGLIVTGGIAVTQEGGFGPQFCGIYDDAQIEQLAPITEAVHRAGGRIALQLFHSGRYAYEEQTGHTPLAPSALRAAINSTTPRAMTAEEITETIRAFAAGARRARQAGFDAVEIMGSEGYLINQFLSPVTNQRNDQWGGDFPRRSRFAIEVMRAVRAEVGAGYPVIFRMSGLDLMPDSTTMEETLQFARFIEQAGADALNIGIGWHESKVPTIAMMVPRGAFAWVAQQIKQAVSVPVIASNRINDMRLAEQILSEGISDMVSMARPFLADPDILVKSMDGRFDHVNTCIACNQACLDHIFSGLAASCLVNPQAGRESELTLVAAAESKKIAVVGAGPAGMEAARVLAKRGHRVTLFEKQDQLGGQLNFARQVPGKQEFAETMRYYRAELAQAGVHVRLGEAATADTLLKEGFAEVVLATGVTPRLPEIKGIDLPHVASYAQVFSGEVRVGRRVVMIGAGGIACDLAHYLASSRVVDASVIRYLQEHRILDEQSSKTVTASGRQIAMLRRGKHVGAGLGKTTRWAVLAQLKQAGVQMLTQIEYGEITREGVSYTIQGERKFLAADTVIIAAGSVANHQLADELDGRLPVHLIGGAREAGELDAKRAILEGALLARSM